jgi:putative transposase
MARAYRIDEPGLTYHVWANGVNSLSLFREPDDRDYAVQLLREEVELSSWTCLEYAVMTTHYHVLVRLRKPTLSSGFKRFNVRYAQYFNKKYSRRGHVFDARFQSKIADGRFSQLETARYIARNPLKAGMCDCAEEYPWSGYGAAIGLYRDNGIVDVRALVAMLDGTRAAYRKYVEELDERKRWGQAGVRPRTSGKARVTRTRTRARAR